MAVDLPISNLFLAALPQDDLKRLRPHFQMADEPLGKVLIEMGEPMPYLYFPDGGMTSLLLRLEDGTAIEVGVVVGKEGFAGLPALLGATKAPYENMIQMPGTFARIKTGIVLVEMRRSPVLLDRVLRYAQAVYGQIAQTAVCNVHHTLSERLARWLLMAHDRAETDVLPLTQEFLSIMLAVCRPGVSIAANILQQAGAIAYHQGHITVLDRERLEQAACECYGMAKQQFDHLLG